MYLIILFISAVRTVSRGHKLVADGWALFEKDMLRGGGGGAATASAICKTSHHPHPYWYYTH